MRRTRASVTCGCRLRTSATANGGLEDLLGDATYEREGNDLQARGLYLDEPPWQASIFALTKRV